MGDKLGALKPTIYAVADAAAFLFTTSAGLLILGAVLFAAAGAKLWAAVSGRALAYKAAGEDFGLARAAGAAARELVSMGIKAASALPAILASAAILLLVVGLADQSRRIDDYLAGQKRIAELSATVKNLQRRYKAADIRVDEAKDGLIKARLSFFDYRNPKAPPRTQDVELPGKEIFLDAVVCNFSYSAVAGGSAVNLAIPYKVFSDELPESRGIALAILDESGTPLMYRRSPEQVYGLDPEAYQARLAEIIAALGSDEAARKAGIVRSLYGDAVHRAARKGESFSVWIEESGGLSIKDASSF